MDVQAYLNSNVGRGRDFDNAFGNQCVDWVQFYNLELLGNKTRFTGNAKDIWGQQSNQFDVLAASQTPRLGDIAVWGASFGGGFGHIAVVQRATDTGFISADQNWNNHPYIEFVTHSRTGLIGFMRPKKLTGATMEPNATLDQVKSYAKKLFPDWYYKQMPVSEFEHMTQFTVWEVWTNWSDSAVRLDYEKHIAELEKQGSNADYEDLRAALKRAVS